MALNQLVAYPQEVKTAAGQNRTTGGREPKVVPALTTGTPLVNIAVTVKKGITDINPATFNTEVKLPRPPLPCWWWWLVGCVSWTLMLSTCP